MRSGPGLPHRGQPTSSTGSTGTYRTVSSRSLDEVVPPEWRDPAEYLEPLTGGPFEKLRVGQYRLACTLNRTENVLEVHRIEHRSGAYTADD